MIEFIEELKENKNTDIECKGLFWRASVNSYLSTYKSIEYRESLRLLKRMSCKGCETCDWVWDALQEELELNGGYPGKIEHGKIYTYNVVTSQGYYDLYPEIDYIEFVEVKERVIHD